MQQVEVYNSCNSSATNEGGENRLSGLTTSKSSVTAVAQSVSDPHAEKRRKRNSCRKWRLENGRFVAEECGVKFVPAVAQYDPKRAEKTLEKREALTDADVRDSERFLRELIEHPTINPDQEAPVVIQGENIPALKAAILQGLARASQPRGGR